MNTRGRYAYVIKHLNKGEILTTTTRLPSLLWYTGSILH